MLSRNYFLHGRYRIIRPLGRGGFGQVYEALDDKLDCIVAIKERRAEHGVEKMRRAFEREAKLLANLRHYALPKVMDHFFEGDGQFLVMEFIEGDDFSKLLIKRRAPFNAEEIFPWAEDILKALEYLHTRDEPIIHRDIKPANIKLSDRGEVFVLDFGLAKGTAGSMPTLETGQRSSSVHGYTEPYAPLEQLNNAGTDERSDMYALGATLYHLLTNSLPVSAAQRYRSLDLKGKDLLPFAHEVNSAIPFQVSLVLSQAMAVHRRDRMASAARMRAALTEARLESEETARRASSETVTTSVDSSASEQPQHLSARYSSTLPSPVAPQPGFRRDRKLFEGQHSDPAQQLENQLEDFCRREQEGRPSSEPSWPSEVNSEARDSQWPSSVQDDDSTLLMDDEEEVLRLQEATREREQPGEVQRKVEDEGAGQRAAEEARRQAEAAEAARKAEEESRRAEEEEAQRQTEEVARRKVEKARLKTEAEAGRRVEEAAQLKTQEERRRLETEEQREAEVASRTVEEESHKVTDKQSRRRDEEEALRNSEEEPQRLKLAEESARNEVQRKEAGLDEWAAPTSTVAPETVADEVQAAYQQSTLLAHPALGEKPFRPIQARIQKSRVPRLVIVSVGGLVVVAVGLVLLFSLNRAQVVDSPTSLNVNSSTTSGPIPSNPGAPSVSNDQPSSKGPSTLSLKRTLSDFGGKVWSVAGSPDGALIAAANETGKIRAWEAGTLNLRYTIEGPAAHTKDINSIAFSHNGRIIASGSSDQSVRLWHAAEGSFDRVLAKDQGEILCVAFSPDDKLLAGAAASGNIYVWEVATGKRAVELKAHKGEVWSVAFSPDGNVLASGGKDNTIKFWNLHQPSEPTRIIAISETICMTFSPDGHTLVTGHRDNNIRLWQWKTGDQPRTLKGHRGYIASVAVTSDGATLASASGDKTIKLWDLHTGSVRQTISAHDEKVYSVSFVKGRQALVSGSRDKRVKVWQ